MQADIMKVDPINEIVGQYNPNLQRKLKKKLSATLLPKLLACSCCFYFASPKFAHFSLIWGRKWVITSKR